jgi:5-methyltetrahydrofolate--homocysteine methyltransferase
MPTITATPSPVVVNLTSCQSHLHARGDHRSHRHPDRSTPPSPHSPGPTHSVEPRPPAGTRGCHTLTRQGKVCSITPYGKLPHLDPWEETYSALQHKVWHPSANEGRSRMALDLRSFARQVRITDGVYGTELQRRAALPSHCAEWFNLEAPQAVEAVARSYVEAGSDVIMTNSLLAHRFGLAPYGLAHRTTQIVRAAAAIACRAAKGTPTKVFGSFGPTGKIVMTGETSEDELSDAFAETARALASGGVEAIVLETFGELAEAKIALKAVNAVCDLPVVVSMAFAFGPSKTATMMGESPEDLAAMAETNGAAAVGGNCGVGPDVAQQIVTRLHKASPLPVWIKPNAGMPILKDGITTFPMGPAQFASFVPAFMDGGASFIGGCCGTTPDHIRAVRQSLPPQRPSP